MLKGLGKDKIAQQFLEEATYIDHSFKKNISHTLIEIRQMGGVKGERTRRAEKNEGA